MKELTPKQELVINHILHCYKRGWLPTCREMCKTIGTSSPNGIKCHTDALIKKGWLRDKEGHAGIALGHRSLEKIKGERT